MFVCARCKLTVQVRADRVGPKVSAETSIRVDPRDDVQSRGLEQRTARCDRNGAPGQKN